MPALFAAPQVNPLRFAPTPDTIKMVYESLQLNQTDTPDGRDIMNYLVTIETHRLWFYTQRRTVKLHPAINIVMVNDQYFQYVRNWHEMMLEWPHVSKVDPNMLAYTQDDDKGQRELQTRTTLGKFLKRHCPTMPDHVLRDFVALHAVRTGTMSFVEGTAKLIYTVNNGPKSCMRTEYNKDGSIDEGWTDDEHPYNVYRPEYGWHMAVRTLDGRIDGRCLCLNHTRNGETQKLFVRSYKRHETEPNHGYSHSDEALEAWLVQQGYTKRSAWPDGTRLAKIPCGDRSDNHYIMPYLDGNNHNVTLCNDYFEIVCNGEIEADNTDGYIDADNVTGIECADCGTRVDEDEIYYVEDRDGHVCESCINHSYVSALVGSRGHEEYVHQDNAVWVESGNGYYVHNDWLSENDIVYCEDANEYLHTDDAWICESSGNWYSHDQAYVDVDDYRYHPDYAPKPLPQPATENN